MRPSSCLTHNYVGTVICPQCVADPDIELIEAQKAGDDICGRTPREKFEDGLKALLAQYDERDEIAAESNFGFYVDGFTLASTHKIGEIRLTDNNGRSVVVPSQSLVNWIERRLEPGTE